MFSGDVYALLQGTQDAGFVVTEHGEICFWNPGAERLFGYTAEEVRGRTCEDVLQPRGALGTHICASEHNIHKCIASRVGPPAFDLEAVAANGQHVWVSVCTIIFEDTRQNRKLIAHLAHDISERKRREELLTKLLEVSKQIVTLGEPPPAAAPVEPLSEQEIRILRLFADSKNSSEVAKELGITLPTMRNHVYAINQKLRTHNRLEAVLHAMKRGLI
jgi:PAS domain S-box-containing protein